jgi:hypothetical protein
MKSILALCACAMFSAAPARATDDKPADKPNRVERAGTTAAKAIERTGDRGAKATVNGLDTAGKWTGRQVDKAGKAMGRAADKTTDWVKKKTE